MQKIQMTRTQIENSLNDFEIWEPNIRPALAAAMRDCGAQSIVQTKSAFSSGNGEESRRAKGRFVGTFAELKADAAAVRAAVDSADRKAVGARKYDAMVEAAEWLEDCVESYTNTYIRYNNVEVIAEEEAAPAAENEVVFGALVAFGAEKQSDDNYDDAVAEGGAHIILTAQDYCDDAVTEVGYGEMIKKGDRLKHTYSARLAYAASATVCVRYGDFLVGKVKSGINYDGAVAIIAVGDRGALAEFGEMVTDIDTVSGWGAYSDFAQGVGEQFYAVGATPAEAIRAADAHLKAQDKFFAAESLVGCPDEGDDEGWEDASWDSEESAPAPAVTADDSWGDLLEMDAESDLSAVEVSATAQVVRAPAPSLWASDLSWGDEPVCDDSADGAVDGWDHPEAFMEPTEEDWGVVADMDAARPWSADCYEVEPPPSPFASEQEEAVYAAALDCDPWYRMSEDRRAYAEGDSARRRFNEMFKALSEEGRERVWALIPQTVKDNIGRP